MTWSLAATNAPFSRITLQHARMAHNPGHTSHSSMRLEWTQDVAWHRRTMQPLQLTSNATIEYGVLPAHSVSSVVARPPPADCAVSSSCSGGPVAGSRMPETPATGTNSTAALEGDIKKTWLHAHGQQALWTGQPTCRKQSQPHCMRGSWQQRYLQSRIRKE